VTKFSDYTEEEFSVLLGIKSVPEQTQGEVVESSGLKASTFDWRDQGKLNPVKDQGQCGSCWAFAANAVQEAAQAIIRGGSVPDLSEQELVDCSSAYGNMGCNGGWYFWAWKYVQEVKGLALTSEYKYMHVDQSCQASGKTHNAYITGFTQISNDDASLKNAVLKRPVAVAVDAGSWSGYTGGVMQTCGNNINHAVTLIGFNENDNAWIVRNSWGTRWGEGGHVRIAMGKNLCRINDFAYYVDME
jgi:cathepsin L